MEFLISFVFKSKRNTLFFIETRYVLWVHYVLNYALARKEALLAIAVTKFLESSQEIIVF